MQNYGIDVWANGDFFIDNDQLKINYNSKPSLKEIVLNLRNEGFKGPLLLRFPHLIKKQVDMVFQSFQKASKELNYKGAFKAVFPLKVNHQPNFLKPLLEAGKEYNYGLEAGSKAELLIAISYNNKNAPIIVNGFKDKEMLSLGFLATKLGHDITIVIEGITELKNIIEIAKKETHPIPNIGLRIKLHSSGVGIWAKSGGINSKFGLTSTELLSAIELLKKYNLIDKFTMIHFHIGSQMNNIAPLKKALKEAGNIYANLKKLKAFNLNTINLGGGLPVEYSQNPKKLQTNYSLNEYSSDIIFTMQTIARSKCVNEPDIIIESGRFISASHAVLIAPILELFSSEYSENALRLKDKNPPLVEELYELYKQINKNNALEYLHDSIDHMKSLFTLFDLGYIDLIDKSNSEVLTHLLIKKAIFLLKDKNYTELLRIQDQIQEKYLVNFSLFQSIPDFWGLSQNFPIMPIERLNHVATRLATIWDITCDSDGEIESDKNNPLFLHDINPEVEDYFVGFFLVGAYQEVLGMKHNLFTHPSEATVVINDSGFRIKNMLKSESIMDILDGLNYDTKELITNIKSNIANSKYIDQQDRAKIFEQVSTYLHDIGYLKTVS